VVSEVNPDDLRELPKGIVSCPNCTTMVLVTALAPLHRRAGIDRMVVSTYQSVSGAGQPGMHELDEQWTKGAGRAEHFRRAGVGPDASAPGEVWDRPIAGNVIPLAGSVKDAKYTSEEWKLVLESRKILHAPELRATATRAVPVYVGHAMTANVQFERAAAADALAAGRGTVCGWSTAATVTHTAEAAGIDPVLVGRVGTHAGEHLDLWVTDNPRKAPPSTRSSWPSSLEVEASGPGRSSWRALHPHQAPRGSPGRSADERLEGDEHAPCSCLR
jgi:aspartate-semialdehyde dehydrogenase